MKYFYQSTEAVNTEIDFLNPLHVSLYRELIKPTINYRVATRIMKKAGFKPGYGTDMIPHIRWSWDCKVIERNSDFNIERFITK